MTVGAPILAQARTAARGRDMPLPLLPGLPGAAFGLVRGRVHEVCGPARRTLAAMAAGQGQDQAAGPVLWLVPGWAPERPMPAGLATWLDPGRLLLATGRRAEDLLWAAEEGLRSGAVPWVVAELPAPPDLTAVRRLHLAAEAGGGIGTGLLLTAGTGGAGGVESRWHMAPAPDGGWRLDRLRARTAPRAAWELLPGQGAGGGPRLIAARLVEAGDPDQPPSAARFASTVRTSA